MSEARSQEFFAPEHRPGESDTSKAFFSICPLVLAALLAFFFLYRMVGEDLAKPEDFALGTETILVDSIYEGCPVMDQWRPEQVHSACLNGWRKRGGNPTGLWLANSQAYAMNQHKTGQKNAPSMLFERFLSRGVDLFSHPPPNASPLEHYVVFEYFRRHYPLQFVIVGVCCDDLRNNSLRPEIANVLAEPKLRATIEETEFGSNLVKRALGNIAGAGSSDLAGLSETFQETTEAALTGWLEDHWALWAVRPRARSFVVAKLRRLRNVAFKITAQTERRMIGSRYEENFTALEIMAEIAQEEGIPLLLYVVPIRNDVKMPYNGAEYAQFKSDLQSLAKRKQCRFADLESLVPSEYWGMKDSTQLNKKAELDFMHFQFEGHKLLADELERFAKEQLIESRNDL